MFNKLKQFSDLRKQAGRLRSALSQEKITVSNAALTLVLDGNQEVQSVEIKPEFLSSDKKSQLEKEIKSAVNDSIKKAQHLMANKMRDMGEFKIPGLS